MEQLRLDRWPCHDRVGERPEVERPETGLGQGTASVCYRTRRLLETVAKWVFGLSPSRSKPQRQLRRDATIVSHDGQECRCGRSVVKENGVKSRRSGTKRSQVIGFGWWGRCTLNYRLSRTRSPHTLSKHQVNVSLARCPRLTSWTRMRTRCQQISEDRRRRESSFIGCPDPRGRVCVRRTDLRVIKIRARHAEGAPAPYLSKRLLRSHRGRCRNSCGRCAGLLLTRVVCDARSLSGSVAVGDILCSHLSANSPRFVVIWPRR
jgi:hypothetical protein